MTVYLLHFERRINDERPALHYLGYTGGPLTIRLQAHAVGAGARLTQVAKERAIGWRLVRTWPELGRWGERHLKNRKEAPALCPVCSPGTRRGLVVGAWTRRRLVRPRTHFEARFAS